MMPDMDGEALGQAMRAEPTRSVAQKSLLHNRFMFSQKCDLRLVWGILVLFRVPINHSGLQPAETWIGPRFTLTYNDKYGLVSAQKRGAHSIGKTILFNTREVAHFFDINEKIVYTLTSEKGLPAAKVTGKWLSPLSILWNAHLLLPYHGLVDYKREQRHAPRQSHFTFQSPLSRKLGGLRQFRKSR